MITEVLVIAIFWVGISAIIKSFLNVPFYIAILITLACLFFHDFITHREGVN